MFTAQYDAIVFDFDGTLVDSTKVKTGAFAKLYEPYGADIMHQVKCWHEQHEGISRFVKFQYWHETLLNQAYSEALGQQLSQAFSKLVIDAIVEAPYVAGTMNFLKSHYQKIPLYIASGTPSAELEDIVTRREMGHYFKGIYGAPQTKAEILLKIITDNHWSSERVLMVGDSLADLEGADAVGAHFIGIQQKEKNIFKEKIPTVDNLDSLFTWLKNKN